MINASLVETTDAPSTLTPDWIRAIYSIYLIFIIAVGLPGNIIIAIIYGRQVPKTACDWLIFTMGVTDAVVCFFSPILNLRSEFETEIPGMNGIWCGLEYFLQTTAMIASLIILVVIALDRYIKICKPRYQSLTPPMARHVCGWTVLVSGALCVYPTSGSFTDDICLHNTVTPNGTMKVYFTCVFCVFVFSFILVTFAYFSVCKQIGEKIKIKQRLLDNDGVTSNTSFQSTWESKEPLGSFLLGCCKSSRETAPKPHSSNKEDDERAAFLRSTTSPQINVDQAEPDSVEVSFVNEENMSACEARPLTLLASQPRLEKMNAIDYDPDTEITHVVDDVCLVYNHSQISPTGQRQGLDGPLAHCDERDASIERFPTNALGCPPASEQRLPSAQFDCAHLFSQGSRFDRKRNFILKPTRNGRVQLIYNASLSEPSLTRNFSPYSHDDSDDGDDVCKSDSGHFLSRAAKCNDTGIDGFCLCVIDHVTQRRNAHFYLGDDRDVRDKNLADDTQCRLARLQSCNECIIKSFSRPEDHPAHNKRTGAAGVVDSYSRNWNRWATSAFKKDKHLWPRNIHLSDRVLKLILSSTALGGAQANRCVCAYRFKRYHSFSCLETMQSPKREQDISYTAQESASSKNSGYHVTEHSTNGRTDSLSRKNSNNLRSKFSKPNSDMKCELETRDNREPSDYAKLNSDNNESHLSQKCQTVRQNSSARDLACEDVAPTPSHQLQAVMKHTHSITSKGSRDSKRTKHSSFEDESAVEEDKDAYGDLATAIFLSKLRRGREHGSKTSKSSVKSSGSRRRFAKERQMTYMLLCVTIAFLLSWIPPWIIYMTSFYASTEGLDPLLDRVIFKQLTTIQLVNFVVNPIIYYVFNPTFRSKVVDLIPLLPKSALGAEKS
ncbi:5-hydroxytryptamine receptor [Biomphalaria glabrata]|nr:5-hydroxytryptamine receptor [Biomphalaria glabrata]